MEKTLDHKIDAVCFVYCKNTNPNGDAINNLPLINYKGKGEINNSAITRKLRNRMQDLGETILNQQEDLIDDEYKNIKKRATSEIKNIKNRDEIFYKACKKWTDARAIGAVVELKDKYSKSVGIRGPVAVWKAESIDPVDVVTYHISRCVNAENKKNKKASDTIGKKHFVRDGLYKFAVSISPQLAEKTGFTNQDADLIKECLRTLFVNDISAARPEGSMKVVAVYWFDHGCRSGMYNPSVVHSSVTAKLKEGISSPKDPDDYEFTVTPLDGLEPEIIKGL